MLTTLKISALTSLMLTGAIFGFFYAWVCSTMWGLDNANPKVAIEAMQAMNASVRNPVFAPAFFATAPALLLTGILALNQGQKTIALIFCIAGIIYLLGGNVLTFTVNVRMNEALALVKVPENIEEAKIIWQNYSARWQFWNQTRTMFSGISLLLAGYGLLEIGKIMPR